MHAIDARDDLSGEVLRCIGRGLAHPPDDPEFDRLALAVFAHQFENNRPYRRYCERRGVTPAATRRWTDVPAVPAAAFKEAALVCGAAEEAAIVFRTSGTTQGAARRGVHYVRDLRFYETAALTNFKAHLLPDGARLPMLVLAPPPALAPDSSLSWMLERVRREFGAAGSQFYVDERGLRTEPLLAALALAESQGRPQFLLGTAAALAHLLDVLAERGPSVRLPPGSRAMETGGFKRQRGEIPREEFYARLGARLGLSDSYCVAEYGMTEMCSQFYDNVLSESARGRAPEFRYKVVPPWVRTLVVDAETLEPLPAGRLGVLRHFDLANFDSVAAIQTDDLGVAGAEGFEVLGRAAGAELRGCSIAMDEWLTAQR
jgi:hypothetical protein